MATVAPSHRRRPKAPGEFDFLLRLKEIDLFFQGKDEVHKSMRRLVLRLRRANIPYAVAGGMAVNAHRHERTTKDVDVLLTPEGFEEFKRRFVRKNYTPVDGLPRRLTDRLNQVTLDVMLTGGAPGFGEPGPLRFPDPEEVAETIRNIQVIDLPTLIQLKLAARRDRDFGDVVDLIRANHLDEAFLEKLHPSVRRDYIECLEEKRRDDEYAARND